MENFNNKNQPMNRRNLIKSGFAMAGVALLPDFSTKLQATTLKNDNTFGVSAAPDRRKLGASLEVSSIGIGVQNMSRLIKRQFLRVRKCIISYAPHLIAE